MTDPRGQFLYGDLYLFFAQTMGEREWSNIEFSERCPAGQWLTQVDTGCGMMLFRPPLHPEPVYDRVPSNAVKFARTGGDGVFYSFLAPDGHWTDRSPVLVTFPTGFSDTPTAVVAGSLKEFLRLGRRVGFFTLGDLVIQAAGGDRDAVRLLEGDEFAEWVEADQQRRLRRLGSRFRLQPLTDVAALAAGWRERFEPLVEHFPRPEPPDTTAVRRK